MADNDIVKLRDQFNALQQPLRGAINALIAFVRAHVAMIDEMAQPAYGTFHGGDPRNFTPDPECSTEEERERHKSACALWEKRDRGETLPESHSDCSIHYDDDGKPQLIITRSQFGLGTNCDGAEQERCYRARQALRDLGIKEENTDGK